MTQAVRVGKKTHEALRQLAEETGEPMGDLLSMAVDRFKRERLLDVAAVAYERAASIRSSADVDEDRLWDQTLSDGLPRD